MSYLIDVVSVDDVVKQHVKVIEKVNDLHGGALGGYSCETDDVGEVDGNVVVHLSLGGPTLLQLLRNDPI